MAFNNYYLLLKEKDKVIFTLNYLIENTGLKEIYLVIPATYEEVINEYKKRKSEENSQNIKFSRYIEHSELTDISLNKRSINKEISLEEQVISNLESERIIKEIWKLPTPQNRRVYMYIVDEFSYTKIAKIENRSIPTVKESIDRGLENLRKKLKKFYK